MLQLTQYSIEPIQAFYARISLMFHHRLHQYNLNEVLQRPCKLLKRNALVKQFVISEIATAANLITISQGKTVFYSVLGKMPPRKIVSSQP